MNKFYLDSEAYEYLNEWAAENRTATIWSPYYFKEVEMLLKGSDFRFFVKARRDFYKFSLKDDDSQIFTGRIMHDSSGEHDFSIIFSAKKELIATEKYTEVLQTYCNSFLLANSFMWHGNLVEDKVFTAAGRNENNSKIITFRKCKDTVYAIPTYHHRSPDGIFSVRGHFRKYKNGKVVWIDEYWKGTGGSND